MRERTAQRLRDIVDAIDQIESLFHEKAYEVVLNDRVQRAAFERFLEVLSEASRHVPGDLKASAPQIPWSRIADIGNHLRHAYHRVDAEILSNLHSNGDLAALRATVVGFLDAADKPVDD